MVLSRLKINLGTNFQTKFLWATIPIIFILNLIFGISTGLFSAHQLKQQLTEQFTQVAEARTSLLTDPLWNLELSRAQKLLEDLVSDPDIISARVVLEDEQLNAVAQNSSQFQNTNTIQVPIIFKNAVQVEKLGEFSMTFSMRKVSGILTEKVLESTILSVLLSILVSLFIYRATRIQVIKPLELMTQTIRDSQVDNRRYRINWKSDCEFGEVVENFNSMQTKIEQEEEKLRLANKKLDYIAFTDALTGLPNRACCMLDMDEFFGENKPCEEAAVIHLDLDNFKKVNDTMGHDAGDHLLSAVGFRLSLIISEHGNSKAYRWGGDEFIIYFDMHSGNLDHFCAELTDLLNVPLVYKSSTLWPSASVGAASFPKDGKDFASLMIYADLALYKTKESGRDSYQFFTKKLKERADSQAVIEDDFQIALDDKQLYLEYQPQIDSRTFEITGLEALIRWRHPSRGLIPPLDFIPILEETRLAATLGRFVYEESCKAARTWLDQGISFGRIAINLSAQHIKLGSALTDFYETLDLYNLDTRHITAEVTESLFLDESNINGLNMINELHKKGVRIELDDFGTGYAALSHLSSLPIDGLKIDRSFTQLMLSDEKKAIIIQSLFSMTKLLNIGLICEGVETPEQMAKLQSLGQCSIQGYLIAKPMNFEHVTGWMTTQKNLEYCHKYAWDRKEETTLLSKSR